VIDIEQYLAKVQLGREVVNCWDDLPARFNAIRDVYEVVTPGILETEGRHDPYFVDWMSVMTPIECNLWCDIRGFGLPYYPQYPVGRYFVDFADPIRRWALEADGKEWHDAEKDAKRDQKLGMMGWRVFRFTGRETYDEKVLHQLVKLYKPTMLMGAA